MKRLITFIFLFLFTGKTMAFVPDATGVTNIVNSNTAALANGLTAAGITSFASSNYVSVFQNGIVSNYPSIEMACSNAVAGAIIAANGNFVIQAPAVIPTNGILRINGGSVSNNVNFNPSGNPGITLQDNCILQGLGNSIIYPDFATNSATNATYYSGIGFNRATGNGSLPSATNFLIANLTMFTKSDGLYFLYQIGTNPPSGVIDHVNFFTDPVQGGFDMVNVTCSVQGTNQANYIFNYCSFHDGPVVSILSGSSLRGINILGANVTFNNCTWLSDASQNLNTFGLFMGNGTNTVVNLNNCSFTHIGTNQVCNFINSTATRPLTLNINNTSFTTTNSNMSTAISLANTSGTWNNVFVNVPAGVTPLSLSSANASITYTGGNVFTNIGAGHISIAPNTFPISTNGAVNGAALRFTNVFPYFYYAQ